MSASKLSRCLNLRPVSTCSVSKMAYSSSPLSNDNVRKCLVFPGQGSQYVGMGKSLYDNHPSIRSFYHECDDILKYKLTDIMFDGPQSTLTQTIHAQPAIFVHTLAVWKLLQSEHGLSINDFQTAMGHSLGEFTALTVANYFNKFEDALNIVHKRAQFMNDCCNDESGDVIDEQSPLKQKMLAILNIANMDNNELIHLLQEKLDTLLVKENGRYIAQIAAINSSKQVFLLLLHNYKLG